MTATGLFIFGRRGCACPPPRNTVTTPLRPDIRGLAFPSPTRPQTGFDDRKAVLARSQGRHGGTNPQPDASSGHRSARNIAVRERSLTHPHILT